MTEIITDPNIPDATENNNLLNPSTRARNTSTQSTSTNGHHQVHSDEEDDTDNEDMDIGDGSEYNTYNMDPTEAAKITKSKHRKKDGKKFQSLTSPSQYPKKQKRNWIAAFVILICIILATGAVIYAYFQLTKKESSPPEALIVGMDIKNNPLFVCTCYYNHISKLLLCAYLSRK